MRLRRLRKDLRDLLDGPVGGRFVERYRRKRRDRLGLVARIAWLACGAALVLVGAFLLLFPGPGIPILAAGLACFAQESLALARWCDRTEVMVRAMLRRRRPARERR